MGNVLILVIYQNVPDGFPGCSLVFQHDDLRDPLVFQHFRSQPEGERRSDVMFSAEVLEVSLAVFLKVILL